MTLESRHRRRLLGGRQRARQPSVVESLVLAPTRPRPRRPVRRASERDLGRSVGGGGGAPEGSAIAHRRHGSKTKKKPAGSRGSRPAFFLHFWSGRRDLNPRRPPWQGGTLPLS